MAGPGGDARGYLARVPCEGRASEAAAGPMPPDVTLPKRPSFSSLIPAAKKRVLVAAPPCAVAERDPPEALGVALLEPAVEDQGVALGVGELAEERAGLRVEGVDLAVAEVADEQGVAELPEVVRGDGHPVRRVEQPLRGEPRR